ncbi:MAG: MmpS family transport accessory protein [Chloroflexota bacterium]|nr:MAG: hypothetical protein DIU80_00615 [Chloroflexota bacterium]
MTERRNIWLTALAVGGLAAALTIYFATLGPPQSPPAAPRSARVEYRVTGTAPQVAISYLNDIGVQEQRNLEPPWTFGFRARAGRQLVVSVERVGDTGAVGCAIAVNGELLQDISLDTQQAEARCEATVP